MLSASSGVIHWRAALAALVALLPLAACSELAAPDGPDMSPAQEIAGAEIVMTPESPLAEYPIRLRISGKPIEGATYTWRFGDGTTVEDTAVTRTFAESGYMSVSVSVTDATGELLGSLGKDATVAPSITALAQLLTGINAGGVHGCAIESALILYCWGYNGNGNVGDGTTIHRLSPTAAVSADATFWQVAAGYAHSCALTTAGSAYCWGRNLNGALGDGTQTDRLTPTPVRGGLVFRSIDVGYDHSCAITIDGAAYCWGGNSVGQLGDGQLGRSSAVPVQIAGGRSYSIVRAGYFHSCAIESITGAGFCWGSNWMGQVGAGLTTDYATVPTSVAGGKSFTQLDAGGYHACGTTPSATYCWGWNGYGQIGASTNGTCGKAQPCTRTPVKLDVSPRLAGVSAGIAHSCGIESNGDLHCWGHNSNGQLGDGTTTNQPLARKVQTEARFRTVSAGGSFTCGVALDDRAYCWGSNQVGKLGLGDTLDRLLPTPLPDLAFSTAGHALTRIPWTRSVR